jgi:hypothetical protein
MDKFDLFDLGDALTETKDNNIGGQKEAVHSFPL